MLVILSSGFLGLGAGREVYFQLDSDIYNPKLKILPIFTRPFKA